MLVPTSFKRMQGVLVCVNGDEAGGHMITRCLGDGTISLSLSFVFKHRKCCVCINPAVIQLPETED